MQESLQQDSKNEKLDASKEYYLTENDRLKSYCRDPGFPLQNTKSRPPRKSPKITQKLQFGPPRACPKKLPKNY